MFDAGSMGCVSGSVTVGLRAMFGLIPVAFKLQVYQLCLCWERFPERLCYGLRHLNDIISRGKRKDLLPIGHLIFIAVSVTAAGNSACIILQALVAQFRALVLAGEIQELCLMWTGHEYFQTLTEEICR